MQGGATRPHRAARHCENARPAQPLWGSSSTAPPRRAGAGATVTLAQVARLGLHTCTHRHGASATARSDGDLPAAPARNRSDRPVRHLVRDDGTDLRPAVTDFDSGFDPRLLVDAQQHAGLVELLVIVHHEAHLHSSGSGKWRQQGVAGVMHKAVRRHAPQIATRSGSDKQVTTLGPGPRRRIQPGAAGPRACPSRRCPPRGHGTHCVATPAPEQTRWSDGCCSWA